MSFCSFDRDMVLFDSTSIENMFLMEYMPAAQGDFVRVYLYLRMAALHPEVCEDIDALSAALRMEREAVDNALAYWEREGLLRRTGDNPVTYALLPLNAQKLSEAREDRQHYELSTLYGRIQAIFGAKYMLHPKEYTTINDWVTVFRFTPEAIVRVIEEKHKNGPKTPQALIKKLDSQMCKWAEQGVRTVEDVETMLREEALPDETAREVCARLSLRRLPTKEEGELVKKWLFEWKHGKEEILAACSETTKSRNPTFAYLDSVLESRYTGSGAHFELTKQVLTELGTTSAPTPQEQADVGNLLKEGFEPATLVLIARQCARTNRRSFDKFRWMAQMWQEDGLFRKTDAQAYLDESNRLLQELSALLKSAGIEMYPGRTAVSTYRGWISAHDPALIAYAAQCAKGANKPIAYMDKLLQEWQRGGVTDVDAARAERARNVAVAAVAPGTLPKRTYTYEKQTYTDEDYDKLFFDPFAEDKEVQ